MQKPGGTPAETDASHDQLQEQASRGLWPLVGFVAVSLWARSGFRWFPPIPDEWGSFLGRPPPPAWIGAAFLLYLFSAMVLSLVRMAGEMTAPGRGFNHVAYLTGFYVFYHLSDTLEGNYWAVLVGGLALLTLECYRNWLYYRQQTGISD